MLSAAYTKKNCKPDWYSYKVRHIHHDREHNAPKLCEYASLLLLWDLRVQRYYKFLI